MRDGVLIGAAQSTRRSLLAKSTPMQSNGVCQLLHQNGWRKACRPGVRACVVVVRERAHTNCAPPCFTVRQPEHRFAVPAASDVPVAAEVPAGLTAAATPTTSAASNAPCLPAAVQTRPVARVPSASRPSPDAPRPASGDSGPSPLKRLRRPSHPQSHSQALDGAAAQHSRSSAAGGGSPFARDRDGYTAFASAASSSSHDAVRQAEIAASGRADSPSSTDSSDVGEVEAEPGIGPRSQLRLTTAPTLALPARAPVSSVQGMGLRVGRGGRKRSSSNSSGSGGGSSSNGTSSVCSATAQRREGSSAAAAVGRTGPAADRQFDGEEVLATMLTDVRVRRFLSACRVHFRGCPQSRLEQWTLLVRCGGGLTFNSYRPHVTHVVLGPMSSHRYALGCRRGVPLACQYGLPPTQ